MLGFTALLNRLFPCLTHGFIQNLGIDQSHLWAGMRHPLLNENQAHSIVDEFNGFRMAKSMEAEIVIYQDKNTVSQKTCYAVKRFQRMGFLS
jgi:hypothetical protein